MILIKIFSEFCTSKNAIDIMIRVNDLENRDDNYNKKYSFTTEDNFTHAILLNKTMPKLSIDKKNVIGLAFEPPQFLNINKSSHFYQYAKKHIGVYLIGSDDNLGEPFKNGFGYLWHTPYKKNIPEKKNKMSIMISGKQYAPGHKYRHMLVKEILKTDLDIHILGGGCKYYTNIKDSRIKGSFNNATELTESYEYHICIENNITNDYFSEKIMDSLLHNTVPIYLGCKNIDNYFGGMVKHLTGNINEDMKIITSLYKNKVDNNINISQVEEIINIKNLLNKYFIE